MLSAFVIRKVSPLGTVSVSGSGPTEVSESVVCAGQREARRAEREHGSAEQHELDDPLPHSPDPLPGSTVLATNRRYEGAASQPPAKIRAAREAALLLF